jgi:hypothetical protein
MLRVIFLNILRHGASALLPLLKIPSSRLGLKVRTLGPVASTLTITPPRRPANEIDVAEMEKQNIFQEFGREACWETSSWKTENEMGCITLKRMLGITHRLMDSGIDDIE